MRKKTLNSEAADTFTGAIASYALLLGCGKASPLCTSHAGEIQFLDELQTRVKQSRDHQLVLDEKDLAQLQHIWMAVNLSDGKKRMYAQALLDLKDIVSRMDFIMSRDGKTRGAILNPHSRACNLEGCTGQKMYVRWGDGTITYPCSKGCSWLSEHMCKID